MFCLHVLFKMVLETRPKMNKKDKIKVHINGEVSSYSASEARSARYQDLHGGESEGMNK